jgi:hypothetical protein
MLLFRMLTKFSLPTKISITAHSRIGSHRIDCHVRHAVTIIALMPNGWDPARVE